MLQSVFWVILLLLGLFFWIIFKRSIFGIFRDLISHYSLPIKSQVELDKILKKEQEKLRLLDKNIKAKLVVPSASFLANVEKMDNGSYLIQCVLDSPRTVIAHELYHIYDGTADTFKRSEGKKRAIIITNYIYWCWWEPRAVLYELKRLRALNRQPN